MLKKAGIIVAAAAAGLFAVAPLAFASDAPAASTCSFGNAADNSGNEQSATGVISPLLGIAGTAANANAPVAPQTNAPVGSCNNVKDVLDVNLHDNAQDNSKTIDNSKNVDNSKTVQSSKSVSSITSILGG